MTQSDNNHLIKTLGNAMSLSPTKEDEVKREVTYKKYQLGGL